MLSLTFFKTLIWIIAQLYNRFVIPLLEHYEAKCKKLPHGSSSSCCALHYQDNCYCKSSIIWEDLLLRTAACTCLAATCFGRNPTVHISVPSAITTALTTCSNLQSDSTPSSVSLQQTSKTMPWIAQCHPHKGGGHSIHACCMSNHCQAYSVQQFHHRVAGCCLAFFPCCLKIFLCFVL
jgi:hypothetical protein